MISLIAAVSKNNVIGNKGKIPWKLSTDMKRFATLTKGHMVVMGRKTYESILAHLGKPLPDRKNIVITSQPSYEAPGCEIVPSLMDAVKGTYLDELFIIGGERAYIEGLALADKMYLTVVDTTCEGDAFFPKWDKSEWKLIRSEPVPKDEKNQFDSVFEEYIHHEY